MAEQEVKTKTKRLSKSERTHQRRLKQAARKPGGAMALQMARVKETAKVKAAGEATKKKGSQKSSPDSGQGGQPSD
jgi:hypothetical protein